MSDQTRAVTAADVARVAKVSRSSVSRAFTPGSAVNPDTRKAILKTAELLGYRPNALARSLVKSKHSNESGIIAVVMGEFDTLFQPYMFSLLTQALQSHGWVPMLVMPDTNGRVETALDRIITYQVDGAIIVAGSLSPETTPAFLGLFRWS